MTGALVDDMSSGLWDSEHQGAGPGGPVVIAVPRPQLTGAVRETPTTSMAPTPKASNGLTYPIVVRSVATFNSTTSSHRALG